MLSEVVAGVLLGYGLDYLLGTRNRWIVVGSIAGVAVAMVSVVRIAMRPQTPRRSPPGGRGATRPAVGGGGDGSEAADATASGAPEARTGRADAEAHEEPRP